LCIYICACVDGGLNCLSHITGICNVSYPLRQSRAFMGINRKAGRLGRWTMVDGKKIMYISILEDIRMALNIKDPQAYKLAKALQQKTGETMTHAVTEALRERLERIQRRGKPEATAADLLAIGRRCASLRKGPVVDHGALLYDERGLPK
jgi:antitoxin VapB